MNNLILIARDNNLSNEEFDAMLINYKNAQPMNFDDRTDE
jgi:hypothetical protein